jgi:subtilisin family serine protease
MHLFIGYAVINEISILFCNPLKLIALDMKMKQILLLMLLAVSTASFAQKKQKTAPANWFNLDPKKNKVMGVSTERAYEELLKNKKSTTVIVAVIDGGTDIYHEDLKEVLWVNSKEVAGNGVDDDKNGYVDDIYGWNYIGGSDPMNNVNEDTYELTRLYAKYYNNYGSVSESELAPQRKAEYNEYKRFKALYEKELSKYQSPYMSYSFLYKGIVTLTESMGKSNPTKAEVEAFQPQSEMEKAMKEQVLKIISKGLTVSQAKDELKGALDYFSKMIKFHLNTDFDPRREIVQDDYLNTSDIKYGNNNVKGPSAGHGTHVAGIIAASRNNNIGMKGVADNVRIMTLRVVPDGDERDKDVANAIRYAADNGAKVINMSFGKAYSWNKKAVDDAVKYALSKDVLLVHAAGNDAKNLETGSNFPNDFFEDSTGFAANWIEVGASSWMKKKKLTADFSNYGQTRVDLFAPGVDIYSTVPDTNAYAAYDGTSMASPVTAGVASLLRSYYPHLTAIQIKAILLQSVTPVKHKVYIPGSKKKIKMSKLCVSGGVVNAYKAIQLAETYK